MRAKLRRRLQRAVFSAISPALATLALAVTDTYTGPDGGNWGAAANWTTTGSTHVVPGNGDDAVLNGNATISSVNFNANYSGAGLASLTLDSPGTGSMTLKQAAASTMIAGSETIGDTTHQNSYTQSAGTNSVTGILTIANSSTATGNYTLSGGAGVTLTIGSFEAIGVDGTGTFTQSGGTHTLNGDMQIGVNADGSGTYFLQAGAFNETTNIGVGQAGIGTFAQSGGAANITLGLFVGSGAGSTGTYSLSNGSLSVGAGGADEFIGFNGNGTFIQTGGTHTIGTTTNNQNLYLGDNAASLGTYTMGNAAATLTVNGTEFIGIAATGTTSNGTLTQYGGTFIQSAGNHTVLGTLELATNVGSTGSFTLSGGTLNVATVANHFESVGEMGTGNFTQSGGTHIVGTPTINGDLVVGDNPTGLGIYTLNNAAAILIVNGTEIIGNFSTGIPSATPIAGGTFNQSAGAHTISGDMQVGGFSGSTGLYTLSGGTLNVLGTEFIGTDATGSTFGTLTIFGGTFKQSGGFNSAGVFQLGSLAGSSGLYILSNGTLNVDTIGTTSINAEAVGNNGIGTFTQTGGTHTVGSPAVSQTMFIGDHTGGAGTYNLAGASATLVVNGPLLLAREFGANGSFLFTAGNLTVTGAEVVGNSGTGTFSQSGGANTVGTLASPANLDIGATLGAVGAYTISDPAATVTVVNGGINVGGTSTGAGGTGTLNISAGTATINGTLSIWTPASVVNFTGGTLTLQSLQTFSTPSRFNWTGGTLNFLNGFTLDSTFTLGPSLTLNTGMTLSVNPGQSITNNGALTLTGGTIHAGSLVNNTSLTGNGNITATAGVSNNGQITQSAGNLAVILGAPLINAGTIDLAAGFQLQLAGANATNHGTINLNGGAITGSVQVANASDGIITGPGNISATFINQGTLVLLNGTTKVGSFTNTGVIEMSGAAAQLGSGGTITNNALLEGFGKISDTVSNNATIQPTGGTLNISGTLTNPASGLLAASAGNTLLISSDLATNAGILSLTGGTFDNGNQPLNNTGQITGYGTLRTGGAGLTNNNAITFTGGTSTINGPVTNSLNKTIIAKNDPAIFTGPVTNNGTIIVTNTTITFAGPYSGNAYISDPSTNIFQSSATVTSGGSMTGGASDQFIFAGPFTNNGNFTNAGALQVTGNITNTATFTQSGPQNWSTANTFTNTAGNATFVASNARLGGLTITGGTVDLTSSKFVLQPANKSATLAALQSNIAAHSLISSTLPANFGLALLDNAITGKSSFGGLPADANSLLLSPELLGDANADGHVDLSDLSTILNNFGTTTSAWTSGNFDHSPTIDLTDLSAVLNNFGLTNPNASSQDSALNIPNSPLVPTPEPTSLALLAGSTLAFLAKRRTLRF